MRALLRILATLLGLALAVTGVVLAIEVLAAWAPTPAPAGVIAPWPEWRATLESLSWDRPPVPGIAIGVAAVGLVLVLVALLARRPDVHLVAPADDMTVTTSPRVLARLVGTRVRATDDVAGASVTASARRVAVAVEAWDEPGDLAATVADRIEALLDELPLPRRPRIVVTVAGPEDPLARELASEPSAQRPREAPTERSEGVQ